MRRRAEERAIAALEREVIDANMVFEILAFLPRLYWLQAAVAIRIERMIFDLDSARNGFELVPQPPPMRNRCSARKSF